MSGGGHLIVTLALAVMRIPDCGSVLLIPHACASYLFAQDAKGDSNALHWHVELELELELDLPDDRLDPFPLFCCRCFG